MSVNANPSSGYFYCGHCQENVSQSTYRRHQIMMSNKRPRTEQERHEFSSSSSDSCSEMFNDGNTADIFQGIYTFNLLL
jgi:hypothetical protein